MSRDHDDRAKLALLADALMQDILATSDADIIAEVDQQSIARARTIIIEVKANLSRRLLSKAKAEHEAWTMAQSHNTVPFDRETARTRFEKIRRGDPEFNRKFTLAARNGKAPTDKDVEGLIDDWSDLQRLDGKDNSE
jgi:hypothetical protein